MKLENLDIYNNSLLLSDQIWNMVLSWQKFEKETLGRQLVRAVDSISSNIAEGYGRFHYKENKNFCYYSRGSLLETIDWLSKAKNRKIIDENLFQDLKTQLDNIHLRLNAYINSIGYKK